jgi:hypothetical protein
MKYVNVTVLLVASVSVALILQWKYQPATLDGKAIQIDGVTADVTFQ